MDAQKIGKRIKSIRGEKSRDLFSSEIGVSKSALAMYERGDRIPRDEIKIRIARVAGKTVSDIFFN